jgi:hypothetical protein
VGCDTKLRTALAADAAMSPFGGRIVRGVWLVEVHFDVQGFLVLLGGRVGGVGATVARSELDVVGERGQ